MKVIRIAHVALLFVTLSGMSHLCGASLLIVSTGNNPEHMYEPIVSMAHNAGFTTRFTQGYNMQSHDLNADCMILFLDAQFLSAAGENQPMPTAILKLVEHYQAQPRTVLCIALEHGTPADSPALLMVLKRLGALDAARAGQNDYVLKYAQLALKHDAFKSTDHHTSLLTKHYSEKRTQAAQELVMPPLPTYLAHHGFRIMPQTVVPKDQARFPTGLLIPNSTHNNWVVLTKANMILFSGVYNNFFYAPLTPAEQHKHLHAVQDLLVSLHSVATTQEPPLHIDQQPLPKTLTDSHIHEIKRKIRAQRARHRDNKYAWIETEGIRAGWMDVEAYHGTEKEAAKAIADANLNLLWFTFNPELHLSTIARFTVMPDTQDTATTYREDYLVKIERFTKALADHYKQIDTPLPHLFAGLDVTSNYSHTPPPEIAANMFGRSFDKIPCHLDYETFWKPEVVEVFKRFVELWRTRIGNGVPISGLFLDLEMYQAQDQSGDYDSVMGFSKLPWTIYCSHNASLHLSDATTPLERATLLYHKGLLTDYFNVLMRHAYSIGQRLTRDIRAIVPNAMMATYAMTLPYQWFYRGFLAGLSTSADPIILCTFSNDYYAQYKQLVADTLYSYHATVILLSKLRQHTDLDLIHHLKPYHDGIWYNRFSRLMQKYDSTEWWHTEATPLAEHALDDVITAIKAPFKDL